MVLPGGAGLETSFFRSAPITNFILMSVHTHFQYFVSILRCAVMLGSSQELNSPAVGKQGDAHDLQFGRNHVIYNTFSISSSTRAARAP
jgi:hypothetical protein